MNRFIFLYVLLAVHVVVQAQSGGGGQTSGPESVNFQTATDLLPPSPQASSIVKGAELSMNQNTGAPHLQIKLLDFKGRNNSVPVSLQYSTSGIKVDEIASRVGMGWTIYAGGVITRTIRGVRDEIAGGRAVTVPATSCEYLTFLDNLAQSRENSGGLDGEPDLFSFSVGGVLSGSFVLDENMQAVFVPAEKYKLEHNFSGTDWNFKITDTKGNQYFFGGASATEKTKRTSSCYRSYISFNATAWYLTKIKFSNSEEINFVYTPHTYAYDSGIAQDMEFHYPDRDYSYVNGSFMPPDGTPSCQTSSPIPTSYIGFPLTCANKMETQGVLLNQVNTGNSQVIFGYGTRNDCTDKLITQIQYKEGGNVIKTFSLSYQQIMSTGNAAQSSPGQNYTPYLTSLKEYSQDMTENRQHIFEYNDPQGRAPRLSFSQDHWGYFNGRQNTSFIPKPEVYEYHFPDATANREPDPFYASKGMLKKIIYPTGGVEEYEYEGNSIVIQNTAYDNRYSYTSCIVTGNGDGHGPDGTNTNYYSFTITQSQQVQIIAESISTGVGDYQPDHPFLNASEVGLKKSDGTIVVLNPAMINYQATETMTSNTLSPGTYNLMYSARGAAVGTKITLKYVRSTTPQSGLVNKTIGGIRVKRILSYKGEINNPVQIKRFYYGELNTPELASAAYYREPEYMRGAIKQQFCQSYIGAGDYLPSVILYHGVHLFSNSAVNINPFNALPASYGSVIESRGENFESGCIQTKFHTTADANAVLLHGRSMNGVSNTNFAANYNGRILEKNIYKMGLSAQLIPVEKTNWEYLVDDRHSKSVNAYVALQEFGLRASSTDCATGGSPDTRFLPSYNLMKYEVISKWMHPIKETKTEYNDQGSVLMVTNTDFEYNGTNHLAVTGKSALASDNVLESKHYTYPENHINNNVFDQMITANMITAPVTITNKKNGQTVEKQQINYANVGAVYNRQIYDIASIEKSIYNNVPETEGVFSRYDEYGHVTEFKGHDGIIATVIWGYNYRYPIAKIENAAYNLVESTIPGGISGLQNKTEAELLTIFLNLRNSLPGAFITSYTYLPGIGVSTFTDKRLQKISYEYDGFGALKAMRDHNGNVTQKNEYKYIGPAAATTLPVYYNAQLVKSYTRQSCQTPFAGTIVNYIIHAGKYSSRISQQDADQQAQNDNEGQLFANKNGECVFVCQTPSSYLNVLKSGTFTRNNCPSGQTGSTITYTVPAGTYSSTISQADANAKAQADINANGQNYANINGSCTVPSSNDISVSLSAAFTGSSTLYPVTLKFYQGGVLKYTYTLTASVPSQTVTVLSGTYAVEATINTSQYAGLSIWKSSVYSNYWDIVPPGVSVTSDPVNFNSSGFTVSLSNAMLMMQPGESTGKR